MHNKIINIEYKEGKVRFIDSSLLPNKFKIVETDDPNVIVNAIKDMKIRGAPAIGAAAALCLALVSNKCKNNVELKEKLKEYSDKLIEARPTAYNMYYAIQRIFKILNNDEDFNVVREKIIKEAIKICEEDIEANLKIAEFGEKLIKDGDRILTHCNTGALATVGIGTALGIIAKAFENKKIFVYVTETRPVFQGSRLTAWELKKLNIPYKIIPDSSVGFLMKRKEVDKVIVGADRIFSSGHVINKIGTFTIALVADKFEIPFYVAAPISTFDFNNKIEDVKIEERKKEEIIKFKRYYIAPKDSDALNFAFDITDPQYIDAIITDNGIIERPVDINIKNFLKKFKNQVQKSLNT